MQRSGERERCNERDGDREMEQTAGRWSERETGDKWRERKREGENKHTENKSPKTNKRMGDTVRKTWRQREKT